MLRLRDGKAGRSRRIQAGLPRPPDRPPSPVGDARVAPAFETPGRPLPEIQSNHFLSSFLPVTPPRPVTPVISSPISKVNPVYPEIGTPSPSPPQPEEIIM